MTGPSPSTLRVTGLTKRYGDLVAVDGLELEARPGEILGFLGPNGAGKEIDKRTLSRLQLSRLSAAELMAAISINQVLIGVVALALAYGAALACGYRSNGSLSALLVRGVATTLGVVAISVLTAAFLRTLFELLTVGCFPFFVLMFFSECMFPLPKVRVGALLGHAVHLNDVLPTALCARAFNAVLNQGAGLGDVGFELGAILVLAAAYFAVGAGLFWRRHLRVA